VVLAEIAAGLRSPKAVSRKTLIVRIPPIDRDGVATAQARVKEVLDIGADGAVLRVSRSPRRLQALALTMRLR
jgi:hypothetical protein